VKLAARRNLVDAKRRVENQLQEMGVAARTHVVDKKDVFELQHLHLLSCLETTTVSCHFCISISYISV